MENNAPKTVNELPKEIQEQLLNELTNLKNQDDSTTLLLYNKEKMRVFYARRHSYATDRMNYGGGNYWRVTYGRLTVLRELNPIGKYEYHYGMGKTFSKAANGTEIPQIVGNKKFLRKLVKEIGIF